MNKKEIERRLKDYRGYFDSILDRLKTTEDKLRGLEDIVTNGRSEGWGASLHPKGIYSYTEIRKEGLEKLVNLLLDHLGVEVKTDPATERRAYLAPKEKPKKRGTK